MGVGLGAAEACTACVEPACKITAVISPPKPMPAPRAIHTALVPFFGSGLVDRTAGRVVSGGGSRAGGGSATLAASTAGARIAAASERERGGDAGGGRRSDEGAGRGVGSFPGWPTPGTVGDVLPKGSFRSGNPGELGTGLGWFNSRPASVGVVETGRGGEAIGVSRGMVGLRSTVGVTEAAGACDG